MRARARTRVCVCVCDSHGRRGTFALDAVDLMRAKLLWEIALARLQIPARDADFEPRTRAKSERIVHVPAAHNTESKNC